MPVGLSGDESIPIARYGTSNIGRMKHLYRQGLAFRYGRTMQSIAGLHFNFSANEALWPVLRELEAPDRSPVDFVNGAYFATIRNIHRYGWLLIYLFGCSPAVCRSFFDGREEDARAFAQFDASTLYRPFATSLRMSDIGYRNDSQASLCISVDSLDAYVESLTAAINQPYPPYEQIGVCVDGEWRQLNANILQIENEYYSPIRPKQVARSGEKPTLALKRRGVRYLELRAMDLACWEPAGVGLDHLLFLEAFTLFCLLGESPPLGIAEKQAASRNSLEAACCGRTPGFGLERRGRWVPVAAWARELLEGIGSVADILDADDPKRPYRRSVDRFGAAVGDPDRIPAARMLLEMKSRGESFAEFARRLSLEHADHWRQRPLSTERAREFEREARDSLEQQRLIEASDTLSFEDFLDRYFKQA
jgi:glutamate--cysteine ligase